VYNTNLMTSVMRPDPRYELALASQVPHTQTEHPDTSAVAVTFFQIHDFLNEFLQSINFNNEIPITSKIAIYAGCRHCKGNATQNVDLIELNFGNGC